MYVTCRLRRYAAQKYSRHVPPAEGRVAQFKNARSECHSDERAQRARRNLQEDQLTDSSHKLNSLSGIDQFPSCRFLPFELDSTP
jgi:hypothetical protein